MAILGIDWGEAKVGLSLAQGVIAEPYSVIKYGDRQYLGGELNKIIKKEGVDLIVLGISEGVSELKAQEFKKDVLEKLGVSVIFWDETLTTEEAQAKAIEAKVSRKRRRELEDAFAAAVMLQSYLEVHA